VVGTGLDVVYPSSSRELWAEVARRGIVFSESPLGTPPHPGVFPARNRIIAALSDVVVVVESHLQGGALYTADAAARRSIPVCAVPGSVHSRASAGSNALLVDGCIPVRDADDVMVALGLVRAGKNLAPIRRAGRTTRRSEAGRSRRGRPDRSKSRPGEPGSKDAAVSHDQSGRVEPARVNAACGGAACGGGEEPLVERDGRLEPGRAGPLTPSQQALLDAIDDTPTAFETILLRTDLSIAAAAEACDQLVERGMLRSGAGWWSTA
jgi:predicted Rossmann fold nucleotide-binding protein DprA/Smf involved in DNA uptake